MNSEKQGSGELPSRPPPPCVPGAPPYYDPQGPTYPMAPPGEGVPYGAPPPYYPPAGGYQMPPSGYQMPPGGYQMPPGGYQMPPQVPPTAPPGAPPSLYPDISQLPQPQAGTVPYNPFGMHAMHPNSGFHPNMMYPPSQIPHAPIAEPPPPYYDEHIDRVQDTSLHAGMDNTKYTAPPVNSFHAFHYPEHDPSAFSRTPSQRLANIHNAAGNTVAEQKHRVPVGFATTGGSQPFPEGHLASHEAQSPTGPSRVPARPAPPVPAGHNPMAPPQQFNPSSNQAEPAWWATLRDGEAPPSCVISWKGGNGLKIYFVQKEGHIVSPQKPLEMILFKKIKGKSDVVEESLLGMIEVIGCWRLRLHGKDSYCLHTYNDTYVFLDDSTCPSKSGRIVIIELPADVSKTMRTDLMTLLHEMADLRDEQEGVVDKITTNVGTVYDDITKKINTAVKDMVPGAHKSTKWIRKGTGSIVRFGGNLVSKGMHILAEQMPASQPEQQMLEYEESPIHTELMEGLHNFRKCVESGTITYV